MGNHHVRERAVVQVVSGCVAFEASGENVECAAGTLVTFAPGERHSVYEVQRGRQGDRLCWRYGCTIAA